MNIEKQEVTIIRNEAPLDLPLIAIKRDDNNSGLDDLFGYSASDVENTSTIEVIGSGNLPLAIYEFDKYFEKDNIDPYKIETKLTLDHSEIDDFLEASKKYLRKMNYRSATGAYLSWIMANSYDFLNHNSFVLKLDQPLNFFATGLCAQKNNPIRVEVEGNLGYNCAMYSENLKIIVEGNVDHHFGFKSKNSQSIINGNCFDEFGKYTRDFTALITGNADGFFLEGSKNTSGIIKGDCKVYPGINSTNSSIFVHKKIKKFIDCEDYLILSGNSVKDHLKYKETMQKINEEFGL